MLLGKDNLLSLLHDTEIRYYRTKYIGTSCYQASLFNGFRFINELIFNNVTNTSSRYHEIDNVKCSLHYLFTGWPTYTNADLAGSDHIRVLLSAS